MNTNYLPLPTSIHGYDCFTYAENPVVFCRQNYKAVVFLFCIYVLHSYEKEVSTMRKQKKDGKSLNCVIDRLVFEQLEDYCNEVGQTKTLAVERILKQFFKDYFKDAAHSNMNGDVK